MMLIDPRKLMETMSVEDLNRTADDYFINLPDTTALLQKPFSNLDGSVEETQTFLLALKGLQLPTGSTILDFGAGTCWTTLLAAGFGYKMIACDVSRAGLALGERLLNERPPMVPFERPRYLPFDGRRIELPDSSVDGILCISAFHHVPNQREVLAEFGRVLRPTGRAAFNEPGPVHSRTPQSQEEMRRFNVLENDIIMSDIWELAKGAGFAHLELGLYFPEAVVVTLEEFDNFIAGTPSVRYDSALRLHMANRRLFFMERGKPEDRVSAQPQGLDGALDISPGLLTRLAPGSTHTLKVRARNTGKTIWRPSTWPLGPVRLGARLYASDGAAQDSLRLYLPSTRAPGFRPGETVEFTVEITAPEAPGSYRLEFQLVAEMVSWFGPNTTIRLEVEEPRTAMTARRESPRSF